MDDQRQEGANRQGDPDEVKTADALRLNSPTSAGTVRNGPRLGVSMDRQLWALAALAFVVGLGLASRK